MDSCGFSQLLVSSDQKGRRKNFFRFVSRNIPILPKTLESERPYPVSFSPEVLR
jgi:hypothetical protein